MKHIEIDGIDNRGISKGDLAFGTPGNYYNIIIEKTYG